LSHNEVTAIAEDEGGNLWVGTRGGGLDRLVEGDRIAFVHHAHRGDDPRSLSSDTVRALYKDSRGDLWIGTNAGLDRLVPGTAAEFVRHSADADAPGSLSHPVVTSIAEDRHGNLWVGTLGGGLNKLDRTTGRFTTYSEKDGLSSNLVNAVLLDDRGRVWMSTARGIARYDPESKAFRHYGPEDGVQSDEFTIGVAHRDGRGRMLFGGPNGLNDFHPEDIEDNPYRPPVVLTDLLVSNESVPLSEDGILTRNIGATERLALAYTDSQFAFEFSALNFRQPRKNRFAYRLDGFDEDWTHTHAENRRAVYTNVPPGRYTFRVKAANDDGLWNEDGRALAITIVPPWWHSLWFRGALLLGVLSLAYGGYRWRVGALERGSRKLEAKVSERTESLRLSEDRFRALSESTAEGIGIQEQGTLVDFNVALARIFGYEPDELRGKPILDLIAPESHNEVLSRIESGYEGAYEFTGLKKDGSRIAAEIHVRTIHHGGRVLRAGAIRDVTERKTKEAELLAAKEAAESANRAKSKFLSTMSHELRTPLHAILGFARIIARDASLSGEQRENATIIGRSGEHLLGLIDDVLEMSKLEAGRSALQIGYVDLRATAGIVEEMMRVRAREAGLALVIEEAPDAPAYALCDEHKLRQVLINLVGNAIKYTPQGRVTLRLCAAEIEGQSAVRFEVEDSGIGIASDRISEIFEPFVRHENPRVRATGTGLGLPISQEYVRLMGGSGIQAESRPGEGSVFSFTLPCGPAPAPDQARSTRPGRRVVALEPGEPEVRILIADDDAIGRKLLRRTLEPVGFAIEVAADGREALALHGSWHPHAILIDMRMPRMDGLSAVRGIREAEAGGDGASRTVVVGLTAEAFEEENREMALASGCDDFVTKPFRESELFELLRRHLGVRYVYEEPSEVARIEVREIDLDRRMRNLSPSLLAGLERAAAALDAQAIERLIEAIRAQDSPAAEDLLALAREFRYQRILALARDARDAARPLAVIDAPRG
jgi:PAS domain S-box-containing protein